MIERQKILKESEFKWIIDSGNAQLVQTFLENKIVFLKNIDLESVEGQNFLKFVRTKLTGLVYFEFKEGRQANGTPVRLYDKIYFQKSEDLERFTTAFNNKYIPTNVIRVFDE